MKDHQPKSLRTLKSYVDKLGDLKSQIRWLLEENERLQAKVGRLTARGFEDLGFENRELREEIERLRELLVRCVPLIPQHWELGPNGKMTAKELEKEVSDDF